LFFSQIDASQLEDVGGKGANLGELSKAGFPVPDGFCITTWAYQSFIKTSLEMEHLLTACAKIDPNNLQQLRNIGQRIRDHIENLHIPEALQKEIVDAWDSIGRSYHYAVRSSATAEDLPTASFAGQQDTYLNVVGEKNLLDAVRRCWASLFTDRAIAYRAKNGFDHHSVFLSVVVQRMVNPNISGIMFTADPVNGNRLVTSIDASFGLGEALVSGQVTADLYKMKNNEMISKKISTKKVMIVSLEDGGTEQREIPEEKQNMQVLTDNEIKELASLGKQIEKHFGAPQDIEFCIEDGKIFVVQSRPITSLYSLPKIEQEPLRVLLSLGHIQMMTDPMKPLGLSVFRTLFPFGKPEDGLESKYLLPAGGRLFVDPSDLLRFKVARKIIPKLLANMEPRIGLALQDVINKPVFTSVPPEAGLAKAVRHNISPVIKEVYRNLFHRDPSQAKAKVESYMEREQEKLKCILRESKGVERLQKVQDYLSTSLLGIFQNLFPFIAPFILITMQLKKYLTRWMGSDEAIQTLSQSFDGNISSEMGLEIGDLADLLRDLPDVVTYLQTAKDDTFFEELDKVSGGDQFHQAFGVFIHKFGRRCPGEIDITRPRWREKPTLLISPILGHMRSVKQGEHRRKFIKGAEDARATESQILSCLKGNPIKYHMMKRMISLYRNLGALREHHKYFLITILDECKKVIMEQADILVENGWLAEKEDVYYLSLSELIQVARADGLEGLPQMMKERKEAYQAQQKLQPPRVMTSEGEIITPVGREGNFPQNALIGTPVSAGVVKGKARIVRKPEEAQLHEGEILVAPFTDPGWTPLFQSAIALVTEVGGLMTHGSVVAREYGIPAVVGVDDATKIIKDGQMIQVDGTQGYVKILE
jgi:pyruvate,water dikinase